MSVKHREDEKAWLTTSKTSFWFLDKLGYYDNLSYTTANWPG